MGIARPLAKGFVGLAPKLFIFDWRITAAIAFVLAIRFHLAVLGYEQALVRYT